MRHLSFLCILLFATAAHAQEPRWWKGNLHTHSLWSDGNDFPDQIASWYREHDYQFLALSDHNVLSDHERWMKVDDVVRRGGRNALARYRQRFADDWVETRDGADGKLEVRLKRLDEFRSRFEKPGVFVMMQSEEITDAFEKLPIHINAGNVEELVRPQHGNSVRRVIARNLDAVAEQARSLNRPILAHLNHPNFGWAVTAEDLASVLQERFFEVYNGHPSVRQEGDARHASVERLWDIACTLRIDRFKAPPPFGLATDDSHHYFTKAMHRSNSGRGWVQVRAAELSAEALIAAMERGDFYASSGVALADVRLQGDVLAIDIEPTAGEEFETLFIGTLAGYDRFAEPVRDAEGVVIPATWRYAADLGHVLDRQKGLHPRYRLTGEELYVRAVIVSSAAPENPSFTGQQAQAWTQPVGWRDRVLTTPPEFRAVACDRTWPGHLQGIDVDHVDSVYWSFTTRLVRTDTAGEVIAAVEVPDHHGDLVVQGDRVYVAVNLGAFNQPTGADSWIYVYDAANLELLATHRLREVVYGAGGIAWAGGRFFVVGGLPQGAESNLVYEYDPTFRLVRRHEIPGYTHLGIQSACFADGRFWFGCYGEPPELLVTDPDFRVLQRQEYDCAYGIAALPAGRFLVADSARRGDGSWTGRAALVEPDGKGGLEAIRR